jgi:Xaa-Pro aminopeptidase
LAQIDPAWLDALNPDAIAPHLCRAKGLPASFLRSDEELAALRQAQAQAAQAQQAMAATEGVRNLGGVDEAAKGLSMLNPNP